MKFRIKLQPRAQAEIAEAYAWYLESSPAAARKWLDGLHEKILSLKENPGRYPLAPENDAFEEEIRQLLYGKRSGVYRVLYTVRADEREVSVLHIRHAARRFLHEE